MIFYVEPERDHFCGNLEYIIIRDQNHEKIIPDQGRLAPEAVFDKIC